MNQNFFPSIVTEISIQTRRYSKWYKSNTLEFSIFYPNLIDAYNNWYRSYYGIDDLTEFLNTTY